MPISAKPFSFSEMLRRIIFKSRPAYFNVIDLNKEFLILHSFIEEFNKYVGVKSNVTFSVNTFSNVSNGNGTSNRTVQVTLNAGTVTVSGTQFSVSSGVKNAVITYDDPDEDVSPREVLPPTYLVLVAELATVTYAENSVLAGLQSSEAPFSVESVEVEQYQNVDIVITNDPSGVSNAICVLASIRPDYTDEGAFSSYRFLYHTFNDETISIANGTNRAATELSGNGSIYEELLERTLYNIGKVLNERQFVRRYHLSDYTTQSYLRTNIGLGEVVNHAQLVKAENLADLPDAAAARYYLGLGNAAEANFGINSDDVAPGDILPVGIVAMWSGAAANIPSRWVLCDGQNNTPDLRSKFIVGYDPTDPQYNEVGKQGGAETVGLTIDNLPAHSHTVNDPGHNHTDGVYNRLLRYDNGANSGAEHDTSTGEPDIINQGQIQNNTTGITLGNTGSDVPHENRPPYYTLAFIMYTGGGTFPAAPSAPLQAALPYPNYSTPNSTTSDGYRDDGGNVVADGGGTDVGSNITLDE
jgi:microcystin-dependent protein